MLREQKYIIFRKNWTQNSGDIFNTWHLSLSPILVSTFSVSVLSNLCGPWKLWDHNIKKQASGRVNSPTAQTEIPEQNGCLLAPIDRTWSK